MAPSTQSTVQNYRKVDPVIAGALLDAGLNQTQIAEHLNVAPSSICRFAEKYKDNREFIPQTQIFTDNLHHILVASMAEGLIAKERGLKYFNNLPEISYNALPDHIKVSTINSGNISFGVDYDKYRLQTGQSTQNIDLHAEYESLRSLQDVKSRLIQALPNNSVSDNNGL
jgi:hypothetical protein